MMTTGRTIATAGLAAAMLLALSLASPGTAAASDALDGTYVLDPKASDDPAPLMEALGMGIAETTVARKMKTRMTIDGNDEQVTIVIHSPLGSATSVLPTDGSMVEIDGKGLGAGQARANWQENGTRLVVVSESTSPNGQTVHTATSRYLQDADTLIQQFDVSIDGQAPVTIKRVFRRKE